MENQQNDELLEQQEQELPEEELQEEPPIPYKPRPLRQVIGAWIALLLFVSLIAFHYIGLIWGA